MGESTVVSEGAREGFIQQKSLEKFAVWGALLFTFLLPLFVIPSTTIGIDSSKAWLLTFGVLLLTLITLARFLMKEHVVLPGKMILLSSLLVGGVTLLSALFSDSQITSLLGTGQQTGTASAVEFLLLLGILSSATFQGRSRVVQFFLAVFSSFGLLALVQFIRYFFPSFLSFGVFTGEIFSFVGKWNDFSVFAGLILLLSIVAYAFFKKNTVAKGLLLAVIFFATFFLVVIDFWVLWILLAFFLGFYTIHTGIERTQPGIPGEETAGRKFRFSTEHISWIGVTFTVIALCFGIFFQIPFGGDGNKTTITRIINTRLHAFPYAEVVILPNATLDIGKAALKQDPIFGIGPNRFSTLYFLNKPSGINSTDLWDSTFDAGFSYLPTLMINTGILGILSWIFLLYVTVRAVILGFKVRGEPLTTFTGTSLAIGTLYLWGVSLIYLPNIAILALMFLITGVLHAFLIDQQRLKGITAVLPSQKGLGVAFIPFGVLLAILMVLWAYSSHSALAKERQFQIARNYVNQGNLDRGLESAEQLALKRNYDTYHRFLTDVKLLKLQQILTEAPASEEELRRKVENLTNEAFQSADKAIQSDDSNYLNHLGKAGVSDLLATLGIDTVNTAQAAKTSYLEAIKRNPKSPRLHFALARINLLLGDRAGARSNLQLAIDLRPTYKDATDALTALELNEGNLDKAIEITTNGVARDPNNFVMAYQLGRLYFQSKNYLMAQNAFELAVAVNPSYADARYFLGVCYARLNRTNDALLQFREIEKLNEQNPAGLEEIRRVMRNLTQGRDPLENE